jgi:uncharacterized protein YjiS (DUF1127 family)
MYYELYLNPFRAFEPGSRAKTGNAAVSLLTHLARAAGAWFRHRRDYRYLLEQPDHLLADIGVTRAQVVAAMRKPPVL